MVLHFLQNHILFFFQDISPSALLEALTSIKTEAQGIDGQSISILMKAMPVIFPHLLDLFNESLQSSMFPDIWKRTLIKPINKVKTPQNPGDDRPIAILCCLSKVLEKIVYKQLSIYIESAGILDPFQSGYRKGLSMQTQLLKVTDDILQAKDHRMVTVIVFFDFSKAFDIVPHKVLMLKLKSFGLSSSVLRWFASYLTGRVQSVVGPDGEMSDWGNIGTGVPQGSCLDPL